MCHLCTFNVAAIFSWAIPTYGILLYAMIVATSTQPPEWWLLWWKSDLWTLSHQCAAATRGKSLWAICSCLCSGLMVWQRTHSHFTTTRKWCAIIYVNKCFGRHQLVRFPHEARIKRRWVLSVHEVAYNTTNIFSQNIYTDRQNIEWAIFLHSCTHDIHLL